MKLPIATAALAGVVALAGCATTDYGYAPSGGYRYSDANTYYGDYCRDKRRQGQVAGGVLGGVAGAVIGNQVDDNEGAVIGGIAGAALGAAVGGRAAACDDRGAYWDEGGTYAYSTYSGYRGQYADDWYMSRGCRWARDWRGEYVRVCPDSTGRYRIAR